MGGGGESLTFFRSTSPENPAHIEVHWVCNVHGFQRQCDRTPVIELKGERGGGGGGTCVTVSQTSVE